MWLPPRDSLLQCTSWTLLSFEKSGGRARAVSESSARPNVSLASAYIWTWYDNRVSCSLYLVLSITQMLTVVPWEAFCFRQTISRLLLTLFYLANKHLPKILHSHGGQQCRRSRYRIWLYRVCCPLSLIPQVLSMKVISRLGNLHVVAAFLDWTEIFGLINAIHPM